VKAAFCGFFVSEPLAFTIIPHLPTARRRLKYICQSPD
jgi:hypothetical protein